MIVLGHVPLSDSVTENDEAFNAQLSEAVPPPAMKLASVVNAGGIFPVHSSLTFAGHVINGGVISSIVIVCTIAELMKQHLVFWKQITALVQGSSHALMQLQIPVATPVNAYKL